MNLSTINTQDARDLKAKMMTANINDVKTMIVKNYNRNGVTADLVRYTIALTVLNLRGLNVTFGVNSFSFETI